MSAGGWARRMNQQTLEGSLYGRKTWECRACWDAHTGGAL